MGCISMIFEKHHAEVFLTIQRDLMAELNRAAELDDVLRLCLNAALASSGLDCGGIYLVDGAGGLVLAWHEGVELAFVRDVSIFPPTSPLTALVKRGEKLYSTYAEVQHEMSPAQETEKLLAFAMVPIIHQNRVIASLNVASHTVREVPKGVRPYLESIASLCGCAISRMHAEHELRESEAKYRALIQDAGDAILIFDTAGCLLEANARSESLMGGPVASLERAEFLACHAESERQKVLGFFRRTAETRKPSFYDSFVMKRDGSTIPVDVSLSFIAYGGRQVIQAVVRDMTELRKVEHLKEQIIRNLAHKLKTPIATAQMAHDLLAESRESASDSLFENAMQLMQGSIQRLKKDVERVLEYFRSRTKRHGGGYVTTLLRPTIEAVIEEVRESAGVRDISFRYDEESNAGSVAIEEMDLATLVQNALDNAVKFTKQGEITITARNLEHQVELCVADRGSGIPADAIGRVFEGFYQINPAIAGLGLGLVICREIVEGYGGTIAIHSAGPGQGTILTFRLPKPTTFSSMIPKTEVAVCAPNKK